MFNNPIAWASMRLRGGWKSYAWTTGGYIALLGTGFIYFLHINPIGAGAGTLAAWNTLLMGIQGIILLFFGSTTIGTAIRRDVNNGLIASHRLMPISPATAVVGYIIGPVLQPAMLGMVNFIFGVATAAIGGASVEGWLVSNASLGLFVVFLWVCIAFAGFLTKNAFGGLFGLIFATLPNGGYLVSFVPALGVLMTPLVQSFMTLVSRGGGVRLNAASGYCVASQIAFGAIFFRGAIRRYRRDDVPALGTLLSFLLLAAWVLTSTVGVLRADLFAINFRGNGISVWAQAISAVVSSMVIALVSVSASAKESTEWLRTKMTTGESPTDRPLAPPVLAILAAIVIFPLALGTRPLSTQGPRPLDAAFQSLWSMASLVFALRTSFIVAMYLLSVSYLLRIIYRVGGKPLLIMGIWTALTWLVPLGIEAARQSSHKIPLDPIFSRISPVGELVEMWTRPDRLPVWGLLAQACIAALPAVLFYSTEPRSSRKMVSAPIA